MTGVNYLKTKKRLCNGILDCDYCPMRCDYDEEIGLANCDLLESEYPEKAVSVLKDWALSNPLKTYRSDMIEKFPDCDIEKITKLCPEIFYDDVPCTQRCRDCWNSAIY